MANRAIDFLITYRVIKLLVTPFNKQEAYAFGIIDDKGKVTGNAGTILEKHLNLSKAKDAEFSAGSPSYWRKFILNASDNVFALDGPADPVTTGFKKTGSGFDHVTDKEWDQNADGIIFDSI